MMKLTPMKAIRLKCLDCCCGSFTEVKLCNIKTCPLYPYKSGHKPKKDTEEYNFIANSSFIKNYAATPLLNGKESYLQGGEE